MSLTDSCGRSYQKRRSGGVAGIRCYNHNDTATFHRGLCLTELWIGIWICSLSPSYMCGPLRYGENTYRHLRGISSNSTTMRFCCPVSSPIVITNPTTFHNRQPICQQYDVSSATVGVRGQHRWWCGVYSVSSWRLLPLR